MGSLFKESMKVEENQKSENEPGSSSAKSSSLYLGLGLSAATEMAVAAGIGWWLGSTLDEKFSTSPWLFLICILLFLTATLVHLIMMLQRVQRRLEAEEERDRKLKQIRSSRHEP